MKKRNRKYLVLLIAILTILSLFMFGCGKQEATTDTGTENEDVVAEAPKETVETEDAQNEQEEVVEGDAVADEAESEIPQAEITTKVSTLEEVVAYALQLDSKTPHIIIFNEQEGYLIDMKEGEHYQLKSEDRIFETVTPDMDSVTSSLPIKEEKPVTGMYEKIPNYDEFENPQKALYKIWTTDDPDGEAKRITCYLYAPVE